MIAAHAISTQSVLVTDNIREFRDISGLGIENWLSRRNPEPK
jgi:predicted nucleic acid-binding protein